MVESTGGDSETLKRDALDFHRVTRHLFEQGAIIPFRFPTTLESRAQVRAHLREHGGQYRSALTEFQDKVQMELRLGEAIPEPGSPTRMTAEETVESGATYLELRAQRARRMEQAMAGCRLAVRDLVIDWRQRESRHGVRCFALIGRETVVAFQEKIKEVRINERFSAAVSGPWPPTEFFPVFA